jgi:hypothetical protein
VLGRDRAQRPLAAFGTTAAQLTDHGDSSDRSSAATAPDFFEDTPDRGVGPPVLGATLNRICATPRASLGFHTAHFDTSYMFGIKVTNYWSTADMLACYPEAAKKSLDRHGGLTADIKTVKNGPELWAIIDPCPKEMF